ncbi:MAG: LysR family transcriptional regulator [Salinisphaeraceae bacterium]
MAYALDDIEAFLRVVETGSISAAARRLQRTKSVVSKRVSALEAAFGVRLLHRSARGMTATDAGRDFYRRARAALAELEAAGEDLATDEQALRGSLRITAPMSFSTLILGPALFAFLRDHPGLQLDLDLDDRAADIAVGGFDLAIRIGHLRDSNLVARKLGTAERVIVASRDYADTHGLPASLDELPQHPAIGYTHVAATELWRFHGDDGPARHVPMTCRLVVNNGEAMRDAVLAGLGLALLPRFILADALADGRLVAVLPNAKPEHYGIHALYPYQRQPARKVRALVEYLQRTLKKI